MKIIRYPLASGPKTETSVAFGNFDGFHRGHQAVIGEAGRHARTDGVTFAVFTTEPHPRRFFAPGADAFRLTPFRERARLLENFGVETLFLPRFDKALAVMPAEDFILNMCLGAMRARHIVIGYDYRFGKGRKGDAELMQKIAGREGAEVHVVEPVSFGVEGVAGEVYSSSKVRDALRNGQARYAAALLGHWWTVAGRVGRGDSRGRDMGYPTANLTLGDAIVPRLGIYAVRVIDETQDPDCVREGVASIGVRPTFGESDVLLEVHLFGFDGDLYGHRLRVELVGFIREEKTFAGAEDLIPAMHADSAAAKAMLSDPENSRGHLSPPVLDDYLAAR